MKKISVIISKENKHAVTDWGVKEWYQNLIGEGETVYVSTNIMFNELRLGVRLNELEPFSFEFNGKTFNIGTKGELTPYWPEYFQDHQGVQIKALMNGCSRDIARSKIRKA